MKTGVILLNTGSPRQAESACIQEFLQAFLSDPKVIRLPGFLRRMLIKRVVPRRAQELQPVYQSIAIRGQSPLYHYSARLCQELNQSFAAQKMQLQFNYAFLYSRPSLSEAAQQALQKGCQRLLVVALYPQSSGTTTGAARAQTKKLQQELEAQYADRPDDMPQLRFLSGYCQETAYLEAISDSLHSAVPDLPERKVFFSYHSLPRAYLRDMQEKSYILQCISTSDAVATLLGLEDYQTVYQSKFGPMRWHGPFLKDALREHAASGSGKKAAVICPGFALDCLETLHEVDIQIRLELKEEGADVDFVYVPCLNAGALQRKMLLQLVKMNLNTCRNLY